jgi:hypothetical protein
MFWDRTVWQERDWFFGSSWGASEWRIVIAPLLALPQITHYVLDGFIWRRKSNPGLGLFADEQVRPGTGSPNN